MERLTIRNSDGSVSQPTDLKWAEALEKLAAYEDAEEEGRLFEVPFPFGREVFSIHDGKIYSADVFGYRLHEWGTHEVLLIFDHPKYNGSYLFRVNDLGKSWFMTHEDAVNACHKHIEVLKMINGRPTHGK